MNKTQEMLKHPVQSGRLLINTLFPISAVRRYSSLARPFQRLHHFGSDLRVQVGETNALRGDVASAASEIRGAVRRDQRAVMAETFSLARQDAAELIKKLEKTTKTETEHNPHEDQVRENQTYAALRRKIAYSREYERVIHPGGWARFWDNIL